MRPPVRPAERSTNGAGANLSRMSSPYPAGPDLRLHTSWRGILGAAFSPAALLALGGLALLDGGYRTFPALMLLAGVALLLGVLWDYPYAVTFRATGITRHTALRSQTLPWEGLVALERTRPSTTTVLRNLTDRHAEPYVSGGLVARGRGHRRWLLTDRIESRSEHDHLRALLADLDEPVHVRAARPHAEAAPTYLYRRRDVGRSSR
jgi:hypothetical protein